MVGEGQRRVALDALSVIGATSWLLGLLGLLFFALALAPADRRWALPWGCVFFLAALGLPVTAAREYLPWFVAVQIGNALLIGYGSLAFNAARLFMGRRPNWLLGALGPGLWLALCQVPAFYDSFFARVLGFALIALSYSTLTTIELSQGGGRWSVARRILVGAFAAHALLMAVRPVMAMTAIQASNPTALPNSPLLVAFALAAMAHAVIIAFSIMALARERSLEAEQRNLTAAAQAARSANEAKSRFLARLSHDLRTPLNSMLGFAQVLAADERLPDEQRAQATTLAEGGRHLLNLLNDLVDLARIEAGRITLSPRPMHLPAFLEQCAALLRAEAAARGISLVLEAGRELPGMVIADETRLRQIILNLVSNAIKYGAPQDRIELTVSRGKGGAFRFVVADRGPGISPALRQRLFEDYARLHAEAVGPAGTGLGLSISQALARAMGGQLSYADRPGGGAVFTLEVPLQAASLPTPPARGAGAQALCVLVVEDLRPNRRVLRAMLEQAGHRVLEAEEIGAALTTLASMPVDLVLLDLDAPGGEGLSTFRAIRTRGLTVAGRGEPLAVMGLSRQPSAFQGVPVAEPGFAAVIAKPVVREELLGQLAALQARRPASA